MAIEFQKLEDDSPMPFGQYKGRKMEEVPAHYLLWFYQENKDMTVSEFMTPMQQSRKQVLAYCADNLDVLEKETKK